MNGENQLADLKLWVLFVEKWYPETICAAFKTCVGWKLSWVTIIQATAQNCMYPFAGDTPLKTVWLATGHLQMMLYNCEEFI